MERNSDLNDSHPSLPGQDVRVAWYPNPCDPLGGFRKILFGRCCGLCGACVCSTGREWHTATGLQ